MSIRIGEFAHSECYPSSPKWGEPGDQLMPKNPGKVFDGEVRVRYMSVEDFTAVYRPVSAEVAEHIAVNMERAARNPAVGYSQWNGASPRTTFYEELKKAGGDASKITNKCNGDCSAGTAALLKVEGIPVSANMNTATAPEQLRSTHQFLEIEIKSVVKSFTQFMPYLMRGDILYRSGHMGICLDNGDLSIPFPVKATGDVWQRLYPGLQSDTQLRVIDLGAQADAYLPAVDADGRDWVITEYNGRRGWTSGRYLEGVIWIVSDATVYIRQEPATTGKIINVGEAGYQYPGTGNVRADGRGVLWYQLITDGVIGWISSRFSHIDR